MHNVFWKSQNKEESQEEADIRRRVLTKTVSLYQKPARAHPTQHLKIKII